MGVSVLLGLQILGLRAHVQDAIAGDLSVSSAAVSTLGEAVAQQAAHWSEHAPKAIVLENLDVNAAELVGALRNALVVHGSSPGGPEDVLDREEIVVALYNCRVAGYMDLSGLYGAAADDDALAESERRASEAPLLGFQFRDCDFDFLSFGDTKGPGELGSQAYPTSSHLASGDAPESGGADSRIRNPLPGELAFHNCRIEELWFHGIDAHGAVQISACEIGSLSWANSVFRERVFLGDTTILHAADFTRVRFERDLKVLDGTFRGFVEFEEAAFQGPTSLHGTFEELADFEGARFAAALDISGTRFLSGAYLALASFEGAAKSARGEALLRSSLGWKAVGDQSRAAYYFREHMVELRSSKPLPVALLEMVLVDWTSGYGTMWHRILLTWAVIILAGTAVLWIGRGIESAHDRAPIRSFRLSLYFGIVTFTTLGYGDYRPRGAFRIVASITALLGAFMMALFVVVFMRQFAP